jgi:hypothetical protein
VVVVGAGLADDGDAVGAAVGSGVGAVLESRVHPDRTTNRTAAMAPASLLTTDQRSRLARRSRELSS